MTGTPGPLLRLAGLEVFVDASTIDLTGEALEWFEADFSRTGLLDAAPQGGAVAVVCGQEIGHVRLTLELWDAAPPVRLEGWQDAAEVSAHWTEDVMLLGGGPADDEVTVPLPGPGAYRVRAHGTHRDDGDPRTLDDPVEEYLIQVWPAPPGEPALLKATSATGALWRRAG
ncbi:hypothetical protein GCM10027168_72280 [Streptomyces capparidis]